MSPLGAGSRSRPPGGATPRGRSEGSRSAGVVVLAVSLVVAIGAVAVWRVAEGADARRDSFVSQPVVTEVEAGPKPADDVVIVGDSITEMSQATFQAVLEPTYRIRVRGRGGYRVEEMEPYVIELATTNPEQAIINLGTNDVLTNWPITKSFDALGRLVDEFSEARCVYVVNLNQAIYSGTDPGMGLRAVGFNLKLAVFAAAHDVKIIDWSGAIAADAAAGSPNGPLTSDTIHPNAEGQKVLSGLYAAALNSCA